MPLLGSGRHTVGLGGSDPTPNSAASQTGEVAGTEPKMYVAEGGGGGGGGAVPRAAVPETQATMPALEKIVCTVERTCVRT